MPTQQTPNKAKVAIKCLVYNHEPYLRECLEGFVMQQTDFPFVAIVHDDASTDRSADIIREYAAKYPDIIYPIYETENQYSKKDGSLTRIMDAAIAATGADCIALCEGDDYWTDPYKLQKQVEYMETHQECVICAHNAYRYHEKTQDIDLFSSPQFSCIYRIEDVIEKEWFVPTASIIYRQETYLQHYPMKSFFNGDYSLQLHLLSKSGYMYYFSDIMSVYRLQESGVSNIPLEEMNSRIEQLLEYMDTYTDFKYHLSIQKKKKWLQDLLVNQRLNIKMQEQRKTTWYKVRYFILKGVRYILGLSPRRT